MAGEPDEDQGEAPRRFAWERHEEGAVYLAAVASYIALGVAVQGIVLNWIVGPVYFVSFVWLSSAVLARRPGRRR